MIRYKDGGVFRDSKSSTGRKPVYRRNANAIETIVISIHGNNKNHVAQLVRYLKTAADEAFDYWLSDSSIVRPAYLKTAAGSETVYRYAPIYKIEITGLTDLHFGEYEGGLIVNGGAWTSGFVQVTLTVERGEWSNKIPGEYDSVLNSVSVSNSLTNGVNGITHAFRYDDSGASYSSNLIGAGLPYGLFTSPSGTNDVLFIGSDTPFTTLVFNIGTVGAGAGIGYRYSSGSGWPFPEIPEAGVIDNTSGFTLSGIRIVSLNPSEFAWATDTINGVNKYWIAFIINSGSWSVIPTQQTSDPTDIYGASSATIGALSGDLEALARVTIAGNSATISGRILFGLKEILDGDLFQGYINITDVQDNADIVVTTVDENYTTIGVVGDAPAGTAVIFAPGSAQPLTEIANVSIGADTTPFFKGKFRFFLRAQAVNVGDSFDVTVNVTVSGTTIYSKSVNFTNSTFGHIYADLGILTIYDNNPSFSSDTIIFEIWSNANNAGTIYFYDFVLIPASLAIVDAVAEALALGLATNRYMLIDSIVSPRDDILAGVFNSSNDRRMATVSAVCNGKLSIPNNKSLALWLTAFDTSLGAGSFDIGFLADISIDVARQYAFVRHNT